MKTWRDADHPTYLKAKRCTCYGCGVKCAKSAWGAWCHPCNVERMTRIDERMNDITQKLPSARQRRQGVE